MYVDEECRGVDIQYATIDEAGISFFDFLGDNCDDTVECYSIHPYELVEHSSDTLIIISEADDTIQNGTIYFSSDSSIVVSYAASEGITKRKWERIKDEIYSFSPECNQEFQNTKSLADIMIYAVNQNGNLLWKNYINGGIWNLGASIATTDDGGYLILGKKDIIEWGGCCYTRDTDTRDIMKLNSEGKVEWEKEITYSNQGLSEHYLHISLGLYKTTNGEIIFQTQTASRIGFNLIMMNQQGNLVWSREYQEFYINEVIENSSGQLVLLGWADNTMLLRIVDKINGDIISKKEYQGLRWASAVTPADQHLVITGFVLRNDSLNYSPTFLLKIDDQGNEIWRKVWDQEIEISRSPLDVITTNDGGFLIFTQTDPPPYATLIKTDSDGNEQWRRKYDDYIGNGKGWINQADDGGYFMASGYAVTKLNSNAMVEWQAACSSCFTKNFNNGSVKGSNFDMVRIDNGVVLVGYGSD